MRRRVRLLGIFLGLWFFVASISFLVTKPFCGLRINRSPSLPHTLYFASRFGCRERVGGYVSFYGHGLQIPKVKRVIGKEGDLIESARGYVVVNGWTLPTKGVSATGKVYSPIVGGEIPTGYLFVVGDHPDSFDSRYQECGLIPTCNIEERVWPIF
jgi:conjugal transfer pilin signal peptidase TrbI